MQQIAVDAVGDYVRASSKIAGVLVANVLANDKFAGGPATLTNVQLSHVSLTPNTPNIKLNVTPGQLS